MNERKLTVREMANKYGRYKINTDKYEGHTKGDDEIKGGWRIIGDNFVLNDFTSTALNMRYIAYVNYVEDDIWKVFPFSDADAELIADAPLLLAEVKRLREAIEYAIVHAENHDVIRVLDEVMEND